MKPTKAICCICDLEYPEEQGTYSVPYETQEESGAFFICNACKKMEDEADGMEVMDEDTPQSFSESDYP